MEPAVDFFVPSPGTPAPPRGRPKKLPGPQRPFVPPAEGRLRHLLGRCCLPAKGAAREEGLMRWRRRHAWVPPRDSEVPRSAGVAMAPATASGLLVAASRARSRQRSIDASRRQRTAEPAVRVPRRRSASFFHSCESSTQLAPPPFHYLGVAKLWEPKMRCTVSNWLEIYAHAPEERRGGLGGTCPCGFILD